MSRSFPTPALRWQPGWTPHLGRPTPGRCSFFCPPLPPVMLSHPAHATSTHMDMQRRTHADPHVHFKCRNSAAVHMSIPAHTYSQDSHIYTHTLKHTLSHKHTWIYTLSHTHPSTCKHPLTYTHPHTLTPTQAQLQLRHRRRHVFPDAHKYVGAQIQTHTPDSSPACANSSKCTCLMGLCVHKQRRTRMNPQTHLYLLVHVCSHGPMCCDHMYVHTARACAHRQTGQRMQPGHIAGPGSKASGGVFVSPWIEQPCLCSGRWGWGERLAPRLNAFGKTPEGREEAKA